MDYQLMQGGVKRIFDSLNIPNNPMNPDWRKYQTWLDEGNEPEPMAEPQALVIDENEEKIKAELRKIAITNLGNKLPNGYK